jgi:hypothetical protein
MDQDEKDEKVADNNESPDEFLTRLGKELVTQEGVDIDLASILAAHLLTGAPAADAIANAKADILKLADDRATPPEPEADRG